MNSNKMIIYTNEGNPLALQAYLLGRFAGRAVQLEKISLTGENPASCQIRNKKYMKIDI